MITVHGTPYPLARNHKYTECKADRNQLRTNLCIANRYHSR